MTLLIAILIIVGLDMSGWWLLLATPIWIAHLFFLDDSSATKYIFAIHNNVRNISTKVDNLKG